MPHSLEKCPKKVDEGCKERFCLAVLSQMYGAKQESCLILVGLMAGVKAPVVYGYGSLAAEITAWMVEWPRYVYEVYGGG